LQTIGSRESSFSRSDELDGCTIWWRIAHAQPVTQPPGDDTPRYVMRRASLICRFELVDVLHRAGLLDLGVLELVELRNQAVADFFIVQRAADDLGAPFAARLQREQHDDRPLEGAVVLLVEHVLVAAQGRRIALLQQQLHVGLLVGRDAALLDAGGRRILDDTNVPATLTAVGTAERQGGEKRKSGEAL